MKTDELRELQEWRRQFTRGDGSPMMPREASGQIDQLASALAAILAFDSGAASSADGSYTRIETGKLEAARRLLFHIGADQTATKSGGATHGGRGEWREIYYDFEENDSAIVGEDDGTEDLPVCLIPPGGPWGALLVAALKLLAAAELAEIELRHAIHARTLGDTWSGIATALADAVTAAKGGA